MMPTSQRGRDTGLPSMTIEPPVAGSSPATIIRSVLLPQPEGPRRETNSPVDIEKSADPIASPAPVGVSKTLRRPVALISGRAAALSGVVCADCRRCALAFFDDVKSELSPVMRGLVPRIHVFG